ncbi:beta-glucosidase BglX [Tunturiibacter empetritectus]|uniref:Beta-glucosidase n=1 Tax=Tunturiibacter lichenicola TaxID=2051959 RepID=A0A852VBS6_9BACT|nr:beta-glucosidase BglX [Edaphobacter lichenicola]NYF88731.1 beta-glucosidase [Edaphobacter lichenicola]
MQDQDRTATVPQGNGRKASSTHQPTLRSCFLRPHPLLVSLLLITSVTPLATSQSPATIPSEAAVAARVDSLLAKMTVAEKIGQLNQLDYVNASDDAILRGDVGAFLNLADPVEINRVQHLALDRTRMHIPLLLGFDVINGYRTLFPISLAQAATWDPALVEAMHATIAQETAAVGINWTFAPMLDIARDPRWGRIVEGSGEDPYLASRMAVAKIQGLQGPQLGAPGKILACVKHFAGYGAPPGGRDYDSVYLPEVQLQNVYLPPFRAAVEAGAGSVMSAYMSLNDVPASGNAALLRGVLRDQWGFRGFVVSDSWAIHTMRSEGYVENLDQAALRALKAGENMDMGSQTYLKFLPEHVANHDVSLRELDDAVRPILRIKVLMGLFEHPYVDASKTEATLTDPAHRAQARHAASETAVLLRNEDNTLPIAPSIHSIAVIGPLADTPAALMGSWPAKAKKSETLSLLSAIRERAGAAVQILYEPGVPIGREPQAELNPDTITPRPYNSDPPAPDSPIAKAVATSLKADLTLLILGEDASMNGEYASRASIDLPGRQEEMMQAVTLAARKAGKPVALVLVNGRPLNITWASTHVPSILEVWQPGTEGGHAVADLLFGDANPGGKLPLTWPRSTGQIPIYYAHNATKVNQEAADFKSFYWDEPTTPLYPFGFGLSYTTFTLRDLKLNTSEIQSGGSLEATVVVENKGSRPGDEVVQLYTHQRSGTAVRPVRELKGFERVTLQPGESKTVAFTIGPRQLQFWSPATRAWGVEPDDFDLWVGDSSRATLHETFKVTAPVKIAAGQNGQAVPEKTVAKEDKNDHEQ